MPFLARWNQAAATASGEKRGHSPFFDCYYTGEWSAFASRAPASTFGKRMSSSRSADRSRADAHRNRARLLASAHETFSELGANAALDEVARRAGVGSGTLYRHFATRENLIEALFEERIAALVQQAAILAGQEPPGTALVSWLEAFSAYASTYRGLADVLSHAIGAEAPETFADWYDRVRSAGEPLLVRAQEHHGIRADLRISELLRLMNAVASVAQGDENQSRRLTGLIIEGLQGPTATRLDSTFKTGANQIA